MFKAGPRNSCKIFGVSDDEPPIRVNKNNVRTAAVGGDSETQLIREDYSSFLNTLSEKRAKRGKKINNKK